MCARSRNSRTIGFCLLEIVFTARDAETLDTEAGTNLVAVSWCSVVRPLRSAGQHAHPPNLSITDCAKVTSST